MFLATASTKRPIAMSCLLIALIVLGLNAYRKLSLEDMPSVDIPYVTIITTWMGASPEDVEKDVSKHIEDAVSGIDGLKHIESSSLENVSQVVLEFNLSVDVDIAAQDVREKLDVVLAKLPENADRPVVQKININASPVANVFLAGEVPLDDLYDYADNTIADRFATVPGVADVQVIGGNAREVWVELNRDTLAAAGLTSFDVVASLQGNILSLPGGRVREAGDEYTVRFDAEYREIADIADLEVANHDGSRLRLDDLGTVRLATEEVRQRAVLDGQPGVVLKIIKKAEGNTVAVASEVRKRFEQIRRELPGGMVLTWVSDEAASVQASVDSAVSSVLGAILLCAAILFVFLINIRTTLIVVITMPVTICISLFFMHLAGQSLNTVTLLAIGLSTGVLVANSIVVLENIVSTFAVRNDPWEAARIGASEVTVAVLASAGTNVVVMFPIAMMTSLVGRMLSAFAITTLIVNATSILISFTLTPMLCAMLLEPSGTRKNSLFARLGRIWDRGFHRTATGFTAVLRWLAWHKYTNVPIGVGFVLLVIFTLKSGGSRLGFNFFATDDNGRVFIRVEMPAYYDLDKTVNRLAGVQERLRGLSDVQHVLTTAGRAESMSGLANEGVYMGQVEMFFAPKTERAWTLQDRLSEIRALLADETDCRVSASVLGKMGGQSFQIDYNLTGDELQTLEATATAIRDASRRLTDVAQIDTTVRDSKPEIRITPKRPVLADLGLPATRLGMIVRANVDGIVAANYKRGDRTYDIRVKLAGREGKDQIRQFLLPGRTGRPIVLESVADVEDTRSTIQIYRVDKRRTVKILGDIAPGATMSGVGGEIARLVDEQNLVPPGCTLDTSGVSEMMGETIADFGEAILLAAFLTLLTLAAILESWSRPVLVLLTLPMALVGVIWALVFTGSSITILVLLGMLMLIGVVVNAAILIVDKTAQNLQGGMCRREAMLDAITDQFRPVLMVVLASGLGMLPIAVSTGIGSENRVGIGIASVGGILVAGVLTLTILPLIYTLTTRRSREDKVLDTHGHTDRQ